MLQSLQGHYGHRAPGRVLPNGRDPNLFRPGPKKPFVFAAGRFWDEAKNLAALQAAAPSLQWPVRVAGSCVRADRPALIPEGVQALGQLTAQGVARQMARAAIYALPARYEPFGLSVLEAALSGCALVLGDIPSLREVWQDAALYVPPEDHQALQQTLQRLIDHPADRSRMAAAAQARAGQFSPAAMVRAYLDACASLNPDLELSPREELQCA
jgi:glycosyltransferase involved in cell wall biosynthesis